MRGASPPRRRPSSASAGATRTPSSSSRRSTTPKLSSREVAKASSISSPGGTARSTSPTPNVQLQHEAARKAELATKLIDAVKESVRTGNDEAISQLLEEGGVDVDSKDSEGCTPLIIACRDGRPTTAKLLLSQSADVNTKTRLGATALIASATHGHTAIVKMLLAARADRNWTCDGMRPIDLARRQNKPDVVALLLADGQPSWGSGQPRSIPSGMTGISYHALKAASSDKDSGGQSDADPFEIKKYKHRERLLKLKDDK